MIISTPVESFGYLAGRFFKKPIINSWINKKIEKFNLEVLGKGYIKNIDKTCVFVCNHVEPKDLGLLKSGISPDSFIINKAIFETTGREVSLVINYLLGLPLFLKLPLEIYTRGFIKGIGFVPVGKGKKDFHKVFLKQVEKAVSKKQPILIYPTGTRDYDFYGTEGLKAGAAYIALKYQLPIIPTYIKGSYYWNKPGQKISLVFGKPFAAKGSIDEINEKIKKEILKSKESISSSL